MLLDLESGEYYGLEGAALAIWKRLDGRTSREELCAQVAAAFAGTGEGATRDVDAFLRQLRSAGLLAAPGDTAAGEGPKARRSPSTAKTAYRPPRLQKRGNLKYLGQLD